jgi:hypothetical protein
MHSLLKRILIVIAVIAVLGIGVALAAMPAIRASREAKRQMLCSSNLKLIGMALHSYHDVYRVFPPAYLADENGKPMHSWRVLILPFLGDAETDALYESYRFDEPWDGEHNRTLADKMPSIFACPSDSPTTRETNYLAVVDEETMWPGAESTRRFSVTDGSARTIQIVESVSGKVPWLEPRDLTLEQATTQVNSDSQEPGMSSHHGETVKVLFADTTIHTLAKGTTSETLRALLTRAGGEPINEGALDP